MLSWQMNFEMLACVCLSQVEHLAASIGNALSLKEIVCSVGSCFSLSMISIHDMICIVSLMQLFILSAIPLRQPLSLNNPMRKRRHSMEACKTEGEHGLGLGFHTSNTWFHHVHQRANSLLHPCMEGTRDNDSQGAQHQLPRQNHSSESQPVLSPVCWMV